MIKCVVIGINKLLVYLYIRLSKKLIVVIMKNNSYFDKYWKCRMVNIRLVVYRLIWVCSIFLNNIFFVKVIRSVKNIIWGIDFLLNIFLLIFLLLYKWGGYYFIIVILVKIIIIEIEMLYYMICILWIF